MAVVGANGAVAGGLLTAMAACLVGSGVSSDGRREAVDAGFGGGGGGVAGCPALQ
jgi:hypothetical protein